jgi:hypothetical protein
MDILLCPIVVPHNHNWSGWVDRCVSTGQRRGWSRIYSSLQLRCHSTFYNNPRFTTVKRTIPRFTELATCWEVEHESQEQAKKGLKSTLTVKLQAFIASWCDLSASIQLRLHVISQNASSLALRFSRYAITCSDQLPEPWYLNEYMTTVNPRRRPQFTTPPIAIASTFLLSPDILPS